MPDHDAFDPLAELAREVGIVPSYVGLDGREHALSAATRIAVLRALGIEFAGEREAASRLAELRHRRSAALLEPVHVAWDGHVPPVALRLPPDWRSSSLALTLHSEGGDERRLGAPSADGHVTFAAPLPLGYHELTVAIGDRVERASIVAAPMRPSARLERDWGAFVPLYAVRAADGFGIGDYGELSRLAAWVGERGGRVLGTLPILATFLDEPCDFSPYTPLSRLFWNELFVDALALPEFGQCPEAQRLAASPDFIAERDRLVRADSIDYRRQMALLRRLLEPLARAAAIGPRREELTRFLTEHPATLDYARFRAVAERERRPWQDWPARQRSGDLRPGDGDADAERYHAFVQFAADRQIGAAAERGDAHGASLYLDLPLGVHPSGYDAFRERELFAAGVSVGAPPDPFFSAGQDWGFRPLLPEAMRQQGYRHQAAVLRHHLRHARVLRLDHVMGLCRMFWIPAGGTPADGCYVRYPAEELWAVACLEAQRAGAVLIGENLGTVPPEVEAALAEHDVAGMHVLQFGLDAASLRRPIPERCLAALGTHDTPTFAGFWQGLDIDDRLDLGLCDAEGAARERARRAGERADLLAHLTAFGLAPTDEADPVAIAGASLEHLARGDARLVLVNLEDLCGETRPHNVPGTDDARRPNWRRKARFTTDELIARPDVAARLAAIDRARRARQGR